MNNELRFHDCFKQNSERALAESCSFVFSCLQTRVPAASILPILMQTPVRFENYPAPPFDFRELIRLITCLPGRWSWHCGITRRRVVRGGKEASCDNSPQLYLLETTSTLQPQLLCPVLSTCDAP